MIRVVRAAALFLIALGLIAAPSAQAKTLKVDWREYSGLVGGQVNFRITKIVVTPTSWSVTATVTNNSPYTLDVTNPPLLSSGPFQGMWSTRSAGFGLVVYTPPKGTSTGGYGVRPSNHASPSLPRKLSPKATWRGTFSGTTKVPKGNELRLSFGWFIISDAPSERKSYIGTQFGLVTHHLFRL
jgi:hypothetical protein